MIREYVVFKEYDRGIKLDLVKSEAELAQSLVLANMANSLATVTGDNGALNEIRRLRQHIPRLSKLVKHSLAPWWCDAPSDEKDSSNSNSMVEYYKRINETLKTIKARRQKEREHEAKLSAEERDEQASNKKMKVSDYRIG